MEGSIPDSMLIREIDALRAERDKAIADLEKIETFLHEREEFGQWQADALCGMLKIERGSEAMSEFDLEARWVYLSKRRPPNGVTVLVREPVYENGLMKGEFAYYSLLINDEYEYGVLNDRHERKKEYTLGPIEWNQGNFEWLEVMSHEHSR